MRSGSFVQRLLVSDAINPFVTWTDNNIISCNKMNWNALVYLRIFFHNFQKHPHLVSFWTVAKTQRLKCRHRLSRIFELEIFEILTVRNTSKSCCNTMSLFHTFVHVWSQNSRIERYAYINNLSIPNYQWWMKCRRFPSQCVNNIAYVCIGSSAFFFATMQLVEFA